MTMLFGAILLLLGTASRYRWRDHFALAGIFFNLSVAVGLSVSYVQHDRWVLCKLGGCGEERAGWRRLLPRADCLEHPDQRNALLAGVLPAPLLCCA